jgi:hypothetical protein
VRFNKQFSGHIRNIGKPSSQNIFEELVFTRSSKTAGFSSDRCKNPSTSAKVKAPGLTGRKKGKF